MKQNILIAILAIALIVTGYVWYAYFANNETALIERASETGGETKELLETLSALQSLKIETEFFESSAYRSLIDFSPTIEIPDVVGRVNPFLPIR